MIETINVVELCGKNMAITSFEPNLSGEMEAKELFVKRLGEMVKDSRLFLSPEQIQQATRDGCAEDGHGRSLRLIKSY